MILPGIYWRLETPFVRILGLYSNLLEDPGCLEGRTDDGCHDVSQLEWLTASLCDIAAKKDGKALIIATHHPPYSSSGHSSSDEMSDSIDAICDRAGIVPQAFLSAHAHSYQRFTRRRNGRLLYFVIGTGGMTPQNVPPATGQPFEGENGVTYDKAIASLGYGYVTVRHSEKSSFGSTARSIRRRSTPLKWRCRELPSAERAAPRRF